MNQHIAFLLANLTCLINSIIFDFLDIIVVLTEKLFIINKIYHFVVNIIILVP